MGRITELLFQILCELKCINKYLSVMTGKTFRAGRSTMIE